MSTERAYVLKNSLVCSAVLSALTVAPLYAADSDSKAKNEKVERIIVTSRRKSETLIEIPMNVSTVGAMEIADRNLTGASDLYRSVAGAASPRGELVLRGLSGSNESGGGGGSTIGTTSTFTDGVPYEFDDLYDVERVEILRGPQGTLYGSNAIGGTVRIITTKPELDEFEVSTSVQTTSEKNVDGLDQRLYAAINMPISDQVAVRLTGTTSDTPLSITNVNTGVQGNERANFLRAQMLWQATDDFSINLGYVHDEYKSIGSNTADVARGGAAYEALLTSNPDAPFGYDVEIQEGAACDKGRVECMSSGYIAGGTDPRYNAWELMDAQTSDETDMFTLNIAHDDVFGFARLNYDGSYRNYNSDVSRDTKWARSDGGDMFRTWINNDYQRKRTTHEIRLSSLETESNIDWTVGFFYDKDEKGDGPSRQDQYHGNGNEGKAIASAFWGDYWGYFGGEWEGNNGELQVINNVAELGMFYWDNPDINYSEETLVSFNREQSLFGEASYTLETDSIGEFEFTAGIRFYDLKDSEVTVTQGIWGSTADDTSRPDLPEDTHYANRTENGGEESGNRKKFSVSWRPDSSMSVYALYAEGYRPGGNNITNLPVACRNDPNAKFFQTRYESDAIDNYEVGYKGSLFDNKFRISTAAYQIDWTGVQADIAMGCGFSFTANAAKARSRGLELETVTNLTDDLTFTFNVGYVAAEMLEDVESIGAKAGDDMAQVPKYNVYMALDQGFEVFNRQAFARLEVEAYDEYKTHFLAAEEDKLPSYERVNLSGRIELADGINASLHIKNLFDKEIMDFRSSTGNEYGNFHYIDYAQGRNVTLRLDFNF